jgi:hypothetical protein
MLAGLVTAATFTLAPQANSGVVSPERAQLRAVSAQEGLGSRTLPILRRVPAPGSDIAAALALDVLSKTRFATGTPPVRQTFRDAVMFSTPDWLLEVRDNGGRVRCFGRGFTRRPVPPESQPSYQDVIDRGRRMLENELSPLVPLGPGEEFVPVFVTYPGQGTFAPNGPQTTETIENQAHFGRLVNGIPVVGYGSKAIVMLDNDGNLLGFDVDWGVYEVTNRSQGTVSLTDMNARLSSLGTSLLPADRRLEYVECGYYDAGSSSGNTWIQPACRYEFQLLRQGRSYARWKVMVPAGFTFISEPDWPESAVLAGGS